MELDHQRGLDKLKDEGWSVQQSNNKRNVHFAEITRLPRHEIPSGNNSRGKEGERGLRRK